MIPGDNPSPFTLAGTNSFIIGTGPERVMLEAGDYPENCNSQFTENFDHFLHDNSSEVKQISQILISHGEHDHFGGLADILYIMKQRLMKKPQILKRLDGN